MPSKSAAQHRLMEAVANNPKFAAKAGIPQKVGKDFAQADKGKKKVKRQTHAEAAKSLYPSAP